MTTGERLKNTRIDEDETQESLANVLNISTRQLKRYEKDLQEMGISKLIAFCRHYHVSADYILGLPRGLDWPR